ncbi:aminotransferase class III-fold pyridoxal phosphate-dependent enzyme [Actinomadura fibrosa]|uniref:Aminotransferase class III-fold pyridoxal phosphate-dependent enzyme n=1 Tax=Actinomadura fibrosa TaxID=111802 RepID=A0ABW2XWM1_9ACTN|nr:aminotransferase class III-fold pyridoxal phosphate-dependent enzyme [Actinomadura fibrosa]
MTAPPGPAAAEVFAAASAHLVAGIAERQRILGSGAYETAAEGAEVRLSSGRTVLDFGSYAVPLFGHRPAPVLDAVRGALDGMPVSTRLLANPHAALLAARLAALLDPGRLSRVSFGLNGADAVETALKLAIARTGRPSVLAVEGGFHGKSMGALAVTHDPLRRGPVQGFLGDARHVPPEPDAVARAAAEAPFAALIVEPVQGEGGGRALPPDLLRRWSADAHAAGALVLADEIQCGLRRCGPVSVAVAEGVRPDAVLLGKALGGGVMPLSAVVGTPELFAPLAADPYFHTATFGGHPASCAAGLAALDLLDGVAERLPAVAAGLARGVADLAAAHPGIVADVRSTGLLGAVEFTGEAVAGLAVLEAGRRGLLAAQSLSRPAVVKLLPPAVTSTAQLERAFAILDASCRSAGRRVARTASVGSG